MGRSSGISIPVSLLIIRNEWYKVKWNKTHVILYFYWGVVTKTKRFAASFITLICSDNFKSTYFPLNFLLILLLWFVLVSKFKWPVSAPRFYPSSSLFEGRLGLFLLLPIGRCFGYLMFSNMLKCFTYFRLHCVIFFLTEDGRRRVLRNVNILSQNFKVT